MSVVLAFDYGIKKMGIAVGNTETHTAQPLDIFPMENGQPDWDALITVITEWKAAQLLVGLPLNMDGSESHLSKRAHKFAKRLNHKLKENHRPCAIFLVDERLSSQEARHASSAKQIDDAAAFVLLESWLREPIGTQLD